MFKAVEINSVPRGKTLLSLFIRKKAQIVVLKEARRTG